MIPVKNIGAHGVNKDLSEHELPINAWTDANNIRFIDGYAIQQYGHQAIYDPPTVKPYHVLPITVAGSKYLLYAGTGKIYCVTGPTHTDLTRGSGGDYSGAINKWTSTVLTGLPILNDGSGVNYPQSWDLVTTNNFQNLANWPASTYCKSIKAYKTYLVALNITKTTTNYPHMVKWSHPADPGAVPASWDQTDTTKDAGEYDLEGPDHIVDGLALRDSFLIYKENSIWRMDYVGGVFVFKFSKVLGQGGVLGLNCIEEVNGNHVVFGANDIYTHDGQSPRSILDKSTRRYLYADMDGTYAANSFVVKNPYYSEVLFCYPSAGNSVCNKAAVWNYVDNTVTFRDIPNLLHAKAGLIENTLATTWDSDSDVWSSDITGWNQDAPNNTNARMVMASDDTKLYLADSSSTYNGTQVSSYLERKGLSFDSPESIKLVRGIRPRISGTLGGTVTVKVGSQSDPYSDITWTTSTHTIGSTVSCDLLVSGRYIAIRFETGTAYQWRLDSYDLDVVTGGKW